MLVFRARASAHENEKLNKWYKKMIDFSNKKKTHFKERRDKAGINDLANVSQV